MNSKQMTEAQEMILDVLVKELKGTARQWTYADPHKTKQKIIIEYDVKPKGQTD